MNEGRIIADGETQKILNNKVIIEYSSMILPQISEFKNELMKIGIDFPGEINSEEQMIDFLSNYLKNKK
jgi:hypothetical protein